MPILIESWGNEGALKAPKFHPLPNLKVVSFKLIGDKWKNNHLSVGPRAILQELLNSAPKLEELIITVNNANPDLELSSTKLKTLKYNVTFNSKGFFNLPNSVLSQILERFANSLEMLELACADLAIQPM